jgi:DUF1680 family protein
MNSDQKSPNKRNFADYLEKINERAKKSKVYTEHQFIGLAIAELLDDEAHKSLYIKLAKQTGGESLLSLAKSIAAKKNIKNKGAYFMAIWKKENENSHHKR